ncbi:Gfo/Idh/MocA family oxidoreductase [Priestia megaterium]|uniref:Gfo/Idh/MocA family protein n=1 Tax=Priestia megaterium TaxID=1404 RepID=UPI0021ACF970|nr:Gfo/Idh/MocA family oxidoreductase [Priestia megaterium]MCR8928825.1 Gfo/Idh/MocA family oxidoreductase [Priestia megaterium]
MNKSKKDKKIRVGIIGATPAPGHWAVHAHLPALTLMPQYEVTAVSTTKRETAEETARRFNVPHAFDNAEELVRHPDVDLVIVSVTTSKHAELVRMAIAAKKDVMCEWPLGISLEESEELAHEAEIAGVRAVIDLQRRFAPGVRYFHDLIAEGYVGRVRSVKFRMEVPYFGGYYTPNSKHAADAANSHTIVNVISGHFLDPILTAVGEVKSLSGVVAQQFDHAHVIGTDEIITVTVPDQVLISGTLANGAVFSAHIEAGKRNGSSMQTIVTGTEGDLLLSEDYTVSGAQGDGHPLEKLEIPNSYLTIPQGGLSDEVYQTRLLYDALAKDLAEGTHLVPTFKDACRLHRMLDLVVKASTTGQRQEL